MEAQMRSVSFSGYFWLRFLVQAKNLLTSGENSGSNYKVHNFPFRCKCLYFKSPRGQKNINI